MTNIESDYPVTPPDLHDLYQRLYALEQENARLQRKIDAGPHRKWIENDDPDVVACMGSVPACAENGCQHRKVDAQHAQLRGAIQELLDLLSPFPAYDLRREAVEAVRAALASSLRGRAQ